MKLEYLLALLLLAVVVWQSGIVVVHSILRSLEITKIKAHLLNGARRLCGWICSLPLPALLSWSVAKLRAVPWPEEPDAELTPAMWDTWLHLGRGEVLPAWLSDLLTCPRCLSHHLGFWWAVAVVTLVDAAPWTADCLIVAFCTVSIPEEATK